MELINNKKFIKKVFNIDDEIYVVHVATLDIEIPDFYLFWAVQIRFLKSNKALTIVPAKYSNYTDVILPELAIEFSEYTGINNHAIKLENGKQLSHGPIYSLDPV